MVARRQRDVGLTCRYHLSNIMPDSIFNDSMEWGMTCFFKEVLIYVFLNIEEIESTPMSGESLSYNGLRQMGSIIFQ